MADALNRRIDMHTCRQHHVVIRFLLEAFPTSEPFAALEVRSLMSRLEQLLERHFKLEDSHVYPALSDSPDPDIRATARDFRLRMGSLVRDFKSLCAGWPSDAIAEHPAHFLAAWAPFSAALAARMDAEDELLYPKAEAYFEGIMNAGEDSATAG